MSDPVNPFLESRIDLPSRNGAGVSTRQRGTQYGEAFTVPLLGGKMTPVADEGSYFVATNPTPATGVAGHAAPTDITVDTKPLVLIRNTSATKRLYLDFIRIQWTAAGTNATNQSWKAELDTGSTRYSSGGSEITAVNTSMESASALAASVYFGAVTAGAASTGRRLIGHGLLRTVIPVIGDTLILDFVNAAHDQSSMIVAGTAIASLKIPMPPVVLGDTDQFLFHLAAASQSVAASFEFTIGMWQR